MKGIMVSIGTILIVLCVTTGHASVPRLMSYQGKLTDETGVPVSDGDYTVQFRIYTAPSGGALLWEEEQTVSVEDGLFSVLLGDVDPIPDTVFTGPTRYLALQVSPDPEMSERKPIVSVAYAFRSLDADTAEYALSAGSAADDDWTITGNILHPVADYGLSMRQSNVTYGNKDSTHVCFGIACTTGTLGDDNIYCTVSGGKSNTASGNCATVAGGESNIASSYSATVGGGEDNTANGTWATVSGGAGNDATDSYATVGGGYNNHATNRQATVGGGMYNTASEDCATVGGGESNTASGYEATVGGGRNNTADEQNATVGGGAGNTASGDYATVGGGYNNIADSKGATMGGGGGNTASGNYATVAGGYLNDATNWGTTAGGGYDNTASGLRSTVSGGMDNTASGYEATVGGGGGNTASAGHATVGGGQSNTASYAFATVSGGSNNTASGEAATVGGGSSDTVAGAFSFAAGRSVKLTSTADYTFAFGRDFTTSTPNAVIFHNSVDAIKVGAGTPSPTATLDVNGSTGYNQVRMRTSYTPTGTSDTNGNVGDIAWDDNYIYIKTSAGWKRTALSTF